MSRAGQLAEACKRIKGAHAEARLAQRELRRDDYDAVADAQIEAALVALDKALVRVGLDSEDALRREKEARRSGLEGNANV